MDAIDLIWFELPSKKNLLEYIHLLSNMHYTFNHIAVVSLYSQSCHFGVIVFVQLGTAYERLYLSIKFFIVSGKNRTEKIQFRTLYTDFEIGLNLVKRFQNQVCVNVWSIYVCSSLFLHLTHFTLPLNGFACLHFFLHYSLSLLLSIFFLSWWIDL